MTVFDFVLDHGKLITFAWVLIVGGALTELPHLSFSADNRVFFSATEPGVTLLNQMEMKYAHSNNALVVVHTPTGTFADPKNLRAAMNLHNALWKVTHVTRIDSLVNYKNILGSEEELAAQNFITDEGLEQGIPTRLDLNVIKQEPLVANRLLSEDLKSLGFVLTLALPTDQRDVVSEVIDDIGQVAANTLSEGGLYDIHVSGMVPLMAAFGAAALKDMSTLVPTALVITSGLVIVLVGSIRFTLGLLFAAGVSAVITIAIWSAAGHAFNTATAVAPIVVMTLCIAAGLHIIIAVLSAEAGTIRTRLLYGMRLTAMPSLLALVTTLLSFLSFLAADAPPLRQMGLMVCTGLIVAYLALYTLMPIIALWLAPPARNLSASHSFRWLATNQNVSAACCLGVFIIGIFGVFRLELDDDFTSYFDDTFEYREAVDFTSRHLMGQTVLHLDLPHPTGQSISDPSYLEALGALEIWLKNQRSVNSVVSILDPLNRVARSFPERDGKLPKDEAGIAEYLLLYELSLDQGESLSDFVAIDRTSARLILQLQGLSSSGIKSYEAAITEYLSSQGYFTTSSVFGLSSLFATLSTNNILSMIWATLASVSVIAILVALALRALGFGVACLTMGLVPLTTGFGLWGWIHVDLGLPGAVIVGMTIGILLDDSIHFIHKYRQAWTANSHTQAVAYAFNTAGRAIVITTLALICGFATLCFSGFLINAQLGLFSCLIFALALVYCLGFLPWLLAWLTAPSGTALGAPATASSTDHHKQS